MATTEDQKIVKIPGQTLLPMSPLPPTQIMVKTETNKSNKYKPPQIKPNGIPGRRPMLPTVDMDANELMKVWIIIGYIFVMRLFFEYLFLGEEIIGNIKLLDQNLSINCNFFKWDFLGFEKEHSILVFHESVKLHISNNHARISVHNIIFIL